MFCVKLKQIFWKVVEHNWADRAVLFGVLHKTLQQDLIKSCWICEEWSPFVDELITPAYHDIPSLIINNGHNHPLIYPAQAQYKGTAAI